MSENISGHGSNFEFRPGLSYAPDISLQPTKTRLPISCNTAPHVCFLSLKNVLLLLLNHMKVSALCWRPDGHVLSVAYHDPDPDYEEQNAFFKLLTEKGQYQYGHFFS